MNIFLLTINTITKSIVHDLCYENNVSGTLRLVKMAIRLMYLTILT